MVDISPVWDRKLAMLEAHESQFFEWLPHNMGKPALPFNKEQRRKFLNQWMTDLATNIRPVLEPSIKRIYGRDMADKIQLAEAFEISQYGTEPDKAGLLRLFPMIPNSPY